MKGSEVVKVKFLVFSLTIVISLTGCMSMQSQDDSVPRLKTDGALIFVKADSQICYLNLSDWQESVLYEFNPAITITEPNPACFPVSPARIIFADKPVADYELTVYNLETKEKSLLTACNSSKTDRHPALDGSGTKLVFQSLRSSPTKVYLGAMDGTQALQTIDKGQTPVISPDGTKIAYIQDDQLMIYDLSVGNSQTISADGSVDNPAWSPDNRTLAADITGADGKRFVYIINSDASVPEWQQVTYSWGKKDTHRHPVWSGDGDIIFFTGYLISASRMDIYAIDVETVKQQGEQAQWYLVSDGVTKAEEPCWAGELVIPAS
jgi:Tol biopolymer transport system component